MKTPSKVVVGLLVLGLLAVCASGLIFWSVNSSLNQIPGNELWRITSLGKTTFLTSLNNNVLFESRDSKDGDCVCVYGADKATGRILWSTEELAKPFIAEYKQQYRPPNQLSRIPGVVEIIGTDNEKNNVYVTINYSSLYALDGNNGKVIWGPINVSNYAFHNAKSSNLLFVFDEKGSLSAFDKSNGQELWKTENLIDNPDLYARLLTLDNIVYLSFEDEGKSKLIAFEISNGKELWGTDIKSNGFDYEFTGDSLYLIWKGGYPNKTGQILALDLGDGEILWNTSFPDYALYPSRPQVVNNIIYVVENKDETVSKLVARDAASGEVLWEFNKDYSDGELIYKPYDDVVYVGSETGNIYALDPKTGEKIWKAITNGFPTCMTVVNNSLMVESMHNYVASFSTQNGSQKWLQSLAVQAHTSDCFENGSTVRIHNNRLFVVDLDRKVHSLDFDSGREVWSWHDYRYPDWRIIPIYKPIPKIAMIESNVIYVFNSWTLSEGVFAFKIK